MIKIWPIPALSDNYVWVLERAGNAEVVVVDPGEADPVRAVLDERDLSIAAILLTHHHADHVAGVSDLAGPSIPVYGPLGARIAGLSEPVAEGQRIEVPGIESGLHVLDLPGHTARHAAYRGQGFVLVGDILFAGGCGRVFEGTYEQMFSSLERLQQLPPSTAIYCAHEYTAANLDFARHVEASNPALLRRIDETARLRTQNRPTVPSTIEVERATNPFLRCREPSVVHAASEHVGRVLRPGVETFTAVRQWKDES